jgi:small basic protein
LQETEIEVIVGGAVTLTVAVPDLVVSCVDVAVTVTLPAVLGAVRSPDELMVPALALQVTVEL